MPLQHVSTGNMTESVGFATAFAGQSSPKRAKCIGGEASPSDSATASISTKQDANSTKRTGPGTTPDAGKNGATVTAPASTGTDSTSPRTTTASSPAPQPAREVSNKSQVPSASKIPKCTTTSIDAAAGRDQEHDSNSNTNPPSSLHSHRQDHNSSKLPAFRFADLKSGSSLSSSSAHHLHLHHTQRLIRPSPSSAVPNPVPEPREPPASPSIPDNVANGQQGADAATTPFSPDKPPPATTELPPRPSLRSRTSTYQPSPLSRTLSATSLPLAGDPPLVKQRSASCPEPGTIYGERPSLPTEPGATRGQDRRAPAFCSSDGASTSTRPPPSLTSHRLQAVEALVRGAETPGTPSSPGHRELLLPKRLSNSSSSDESRRATSYGPSISYKSTTKRHSVQPGSLTPGRVPPIRSFRSSGSRKSLTKDMNFTPRPYDLGDNYENHERYGNDDTLRGLDGRCGQDDFQALPKEDSDQQDDNGDVFLRLAREEPTSALREEDAADDSQSSVVSSSWCISVSYLHILVVCCPCAHLILTSQKTGKQ